MSLGCYIISKKKILINKEAVKNTLSHVTPKDLNLNDDIIYIYGDENENQLIEKILSVEGVEHRYSICSLIFVTLNIHYKERVKKTFNILKKIDLPTYNMAKPLLGLDNEKEKKQVKENKESDVSKLNTEEKNNRKSLNQIIFFIVGVIGFFFIGNSISKIYLGSSQNHSTKNKTIDVPRVYETVTFTNTHSHNIYISIGFINPSTSSCRRGSVGWFEIQPNSSKVIDLLLELKKEKYFNSGILYLYAEAQDGRVWEGDYFNTTSSEKFRRMLIKNCTKNTSDYFFVDENKPFHHIGGGIDINGDFVALQDLTDKRFFKAQLDNTNTNFIF